MDVLPKMKYNILVLVCLHILGKTLAIDVGSCSIPDLNVAGDFINLNDIKDNEPFSTNYEFTGDLKVENAKSDDEVSAKYVDVNIQDAKLTIATSDDFDHLEEDLANVDTQSLYPIRKSILFTCNDDSKTATLMIKFYVQDTNNHAPTFEKATFEYIVPSPLIQKIDLTIFGDKIISKDIDLSDNNVTFTTTNANFQIESQKTGVPKERQAVLKVLSLLTFESDIVLDVTATDSGDPPQSSAITITLKKDPDNSVPSIRPQFSKSFYSFDYVETDGVPSITPSEEISIEYTEEVDVTISDVEHVKVNYDPTTKKVTLESTGTPIETSSDTVKLLTLTAVDKTNSDIKSEAAIAIKLPVENTLTIPTFKSPYYEATYKVNPDDTDTVEDLSSAIEVSEKAQVSLDGDPRFTYDGSGIIVVENLDPDTLKKGEDIVLILTATVVDDNSNEIKGFATLIVHLPEVKRSPQFTNAHYSAEYKAGDTDVALKEPIDVKSDADTANIVFSESSPYFDLAKDDTNVWKISPKDGISITEKELVYTLQATIPDGNGDPEESTLIISINTPVPTFSALYYTATYVVGDPDDTVAIDGDITVEVDPSITITVDLEASSHSDNFVVSYDVKTQKCTIEVKKKVGSDIWQSEEEIILTILATVQETSDVFSALVVINAPEEKSELLPTFSSSYYVASYTEADDGTPNIDMEGQKITIVSPEDKTILISFADAAYKDIFTLSQDSTAKNEWNLKVEKPLDPSLFKEGVLPLTLQAVVEDNDDHTDCTLIIKHPVDPAEVLTFKELSYVFDYIITDTEPTIDEHGTTISLSQENSDAVVKIAGQYSENFHVVPKGSGYDIEVAKKLDDKVLIDEPDIVLTLNAQVEETVVATATLVIQLPKEAAPAGFKQEIYQASYIIDKTDADTIKLDQPIELEGKYTEETQVTLKAPDDLDGYFEISKTSPYTFTVITKLTAEYINTHREIILTVDGKLENSDKKSTAVVVIALPELPTFSNLYYTGLYKVNDDDSAQVLIDEPQIAIGDDPLDITVEKPYDGNFKVSYDTATKVYSISVEKPIEGTDPEIYLVLDATVDSAVLVLRREAQTSDVVPKFSKIFYQGTYTVNADGDDTIKMDVNQINIISDHAENTKVAVIDTFASNFETQQNGNSWDLIVKNKLGNSELSENEIPVSLEASLPGGTQKGTATLILTIAGSNPDNLKAIPLFDKPQYTTEYNVDDPSSTSVVDINIESASADIVEVTFDGYKDNFKITRDKQTASLWHIEVGTPLEESVVKSNSELIIPLTSRLENSIADGNAVLIVTIPKTELNFEKSYYEGSYVKESNEVKIGETITVTEGSDVDLTGEEYKDNFGVSCDDKGVCTLSVTKPLDDAVLNEKTEIILVLEATSATAAIKATATIIISLPLQEALQAPEFDQPVYVTKYYDNNTVNAVQIKLKGDRTGIKLSLSGKYYENFGLADKDDHWEITTTGLSDVILNSEVSIPLTLVAEKDGVTVKGQAGLVIDLPKEKGSTTILQFEEVIYIASYEEKSPDEDALSYVNGPIKIAGVTDLSDATLEITDVSNKDYKEYFDLTPDGDHWTLPLIKDLPRETIEGESAVSLTLSVTIGDLKGKTALIVTLPKKFSTASFWFKNTVYVANYNEDGPDLEFESDEGILLTGDLTTPINVKASGDNAEFFNVTVTDDKVDVTLTGALPKEILDNAAITVDLLASKEEEFVSAAVVVKLPIESSSFFFEDNVYFVKYDKNNHTLISGKKIVISGDPDSTANITIAGDNKDYFKFEYKSSTITFSVNKPLPNDFKDSTISLTITAKISDADHNEETTAGLVIEVPVTSGGDDDGDDDSSYDKTGLIAAVAVLAVLLVASLVGSAVFYFLKFRRGSNSGTFRKNSNAIITKIDHPKRRPTGVIKLPLENEDVGETTTDGANMEKRKSVQFDTINIDELEIEKAEEVEEHDIVDVETPNNSKGSDIESDTESVKDSDSDQDSNDDDADRRISRV